ESISERAVESHAASGFCDVFLKPRTAKDRLAGRVRALETAPPRGVAGVRERKITARTTAAAPIAQGRYARLLSVRTIVAVAKRGEERGPSRFSASAKAPALAKRFSGRRSRQRRIASFQRGSRSGTCVGGGGGTSP